MIWVSATGAGFLLVTALVIWLGRMSTARWEREKRTARAPRREAVVVPPPPGGVIARLRHAVVRTAGAIRRVPGPPPAPLQHAAGVLTVPKRLLAHVPPLRRVVRPLAAAVPTGRIRRRKRTAVPAVPVPDGPGGDGGLVPPPSRDSQQTGTRPAGRRRRRPFRLPRRSNRHGAVGR